MSDDDSGDFSILWGLIRDDIACRSIDDTIYPLDDLAVIDKDVASDVSGRIGDTASTGAAAAHKDIPEATAQITTFQLRWFKNTRSCNYSSYDLIQQEERSATQCQKGVPVKVKRSLLLHVLEHNDQRDKLKGYGNSRNFFGRILSGSGKQGYMICFNDLPAGHQDVTIKRYILITVIEDSEEEKEHDHMNQLAEELAEIRPPTAKREEPAKDSTNKLCELEMETISTTKQFGFKWGHSEDEVINWKILADDERIIEDPLAFPNSVEYVSPITDIELSNVTDLNAIFYVQFCPSVVGHAKTIDEFHADL
jgi:hypothetical protein